MSANTVLEDWQGRVLAERCEMEVKLYDLNTFMRTRDFSALSSGDKSDLASQKEAMINYVIALTKRISNF